VVPSHATIECFSGNKPETNARESVAILAKFPNQVAVAKAMEEFVLMDSIDGVGLDHLLHVSRSQNARKAFAWIYALPQGASPEYFESMGQHARAVLAEVRQQAEQCKPAIRKLAASWPYADAVQRARAGQPLSQSDLSRMIECAILPIAEDLLPELPFQSHRVIRKNAARYKFRWATAFWWLMWDRMTRLPRPEDAISTDRLVNDLIDLEYIVPATCFDSFWSYDERAVAIYKQTLHVVNALNS
jgi:hypothetical protein